jgi:hypothetical protein
LSEFCISSTRYGKAAAMRSGVTQSSTDHLADQVRRWINAGVVSAQQGEDILRFERAGAGAGSPAPVEEPAAVRRLSPVAELLSYLGIVLVLVSGGLSVSRLWHGLGFSGRVAVGAIVAGLGFSGGQTILRMGDPPTTRLGWFLWLCGIGGVAMSTAVLVDRWCGHRSGWTVFVTGLVVLALSVGLWRSVVLRPGRMADGRTPRPTRRGRIPRPLSSR